MKVQTESGHGRFCQNILLHSNTYKRNCQYINSNKMKKTIGMKNFRTAYVYVGIFISLDLVRTGESGIYRKGATDEGISNRFSVRS